MAKRPDEQIMLTVMVTLHWKDEIANKWRCPVANSVKESDPDLHHVNADEFYICYSRYSTGKRYVHWTPQNAKRFIKKLDALALIDPDKIKKSDYPRPFKLDLFASSLKSEQPVSRNTASARSRNQVAMTQTLNIKKPKTAANPPKARTPRRGSHSRRFIPRPAVKTS